jgi:16S rRNA (guanine966-N2)-methyltransferase
MRVIAGKYRSRPLASLQGEDIRPTSDRLRETLFNILCAGNPEATTGMRWFDLFAGTGAVGIEALSRGAEQVIFVESSPAAVKLIEKNLESLGISKGFRILKLDLNKALHQLAGRGQTADCIFLDPPYRDHALYTKALSSLSDLRLATEQGRVIVEHLAKFDPGEVFGTLQRYRISKQGDSALSFYRWAG